MSAEAMAWALRDAPVPDSTARVVLMGLANHARPDGTVAFPRVSLLADYAQCSERTVHRKLLDLLAAGVIRRGDQRHVEHLRSDRRPVVYDLVLSVTRESHGVTGEPHEVTPMSGREPGEVTPVSVREPHGVPSVSPREPDGVTEMTPREPYGVTPEAPRGDIPGTHGVTTVSDRTVLEELLKPPPTPPTATPAAKDAEEEVDEFEDFWRTFPRSERIKVTRAAWDAAVRKATPAEILDGAYRYADVCVGRSPEHIATSSNWLNEERWRDTTTVPVRWRSHDEWMHDLPPGVPA